MRVKVEQFCSLATSPSWQTWLFNYNQPLYKEFIIRLQQSHGCTQNREIMVEFLRRIDTEGGGDKLLDFLVNHFPHVIDEPTIRNSQHITDDGIFEHYNPTILTYPRRQIFVGEKRELKKKVREFLLDKLKSDSLIIEGRAYVEYLEQSDAIIAHQIPQQNWQIAQYRSRHQ